MGNWNSIQTQIRNTPDQYAQVRMDYLQKLFKLTGRNVITYYSAWLNKRFLDNIDIDINDGDMEGFMACVYSMTCENGLDLILHTPGGDPTATESIVNYLRDKFNSDIRVIVPQIAMSAGTMLACAGKEIVMGKQSSLGPIDPQYHGVPLYNVMLEFEEAKRDLADHPENIQYWKIRLQQYPAAFLQTAVDAIELSDLLLKDWLGSCMFNKNNEEDRKIIDNIVSKFNEHYANKTHGRHFNADFSRASGLKIKMMEEDQSLQDIVLSLHHAYMISLDETNAVKIIECQSGKSKISVVR